MKRKLAFLERHMVNLFDFNFKPVRPKIGIPAHTSARERRQHNDNAVRLLQDLTLNPRALTLDEELTLGLYSGEGGIGGSPHEYYTPFELAKAMWDTLIKLGVKGHGLEPSCGSGVLLQDRPEWVTMEAVEFSPVSAQIARLLFPQVKVHYNSFEGWVVSNDNVDFVIGNPPFGPRSTSSYLDLRHIRQAEVYFTLRSLDVLNPGGLAALVLPHGILRNVTHLQTRLEILCRAEVLAVHGMPGLTFERSGVEHGAVDVWFLRARDSRVSKGLQMLGKHAVESGLLDRDFVEGKYHQVNPQFLHGFETTVTGIAGREQYARTGELTDEILQKLVSLTPLNGQPVSWRDLEGLLTPSQQKQACHTESRKMDRLGKVRFIGQQPEVFVGRWTQVAESELDLIDDALRLCEVLKLHSEVLAQGDVQEGNSLRGTVQQLLLEYLETHGNPHQLPVLSRLADHHAGLHNLLSAILPEGSVHPRYQLDRKAKSFRMDPQDDKSILRYLRFTTQKGTTENVHRLRADQTSIEHTRDQLLNQGLVYTPKGEWVQDGEFYFGSAQLLKEQLGMAHALSKEGSWERDVYLRQLEEVDRRTVKRSLEDLAVTVHHPKIPLSILEAFARELEYAGVRAWEAIQVSRSAEGLLEVSVNEYARSDVKRTGNTVKRYLTNFRRRLDEQDVYEEWDHQFIHFLTERGHRETIETLLNEGVTFLQASFSREPVHEAIEGFGDIVPHWWQLESTHRALLQQKSITALAVGLGKTLVGGLIALTSLQVGHQKSMVVVPKSILMKWRKELLTMKPDLKLLVVGMVETLTGFTAATDRRTLERQFIEARDGDWEVVLTTIDSFHRLDLDWHLMLEVIEEEFHLQNQGHYIKPRHMSGGAFEVYNRLKVKALLEQGVVTLAELSGARSMLMQLDEELSEYYGRSDLSDAELQNKRVKTELKNKYVFFSRAYRSLEKEGEKLGVQFHELGIDVLVLDEAHRYTNIFSFNKNRQHIRYLGAAQQPADRAVDLYYKTRVMRKQGPFGLHLLTATPLRNSPCEIYNIIKLVSPELWEKAGIRNMDDFVDRYCVIENQVQYDPETDTEDSSLALVGFKNLVELRSLCHTVMHRYTARDVNLPLPEFTPEYVLHKPTEEQEGMLDSILAAPLESLMQYMDAKVTNQHGMVDEDRLDDYRLAFAHLLMRAELDLEMLEPERFKGFISPKVEGVLRDVHHAVERGEKVVIFADTKDMPKTQEHGKNPFGYSFHEKLRRLICERTLLSEDQIAIVNADTTPDPESRFEAGERFNAGVYRVVIGNTETMGEGIDLQKEVRHLLSLDVPINPMRLEQRLGRVIRQGNTEDRVNVRFHVGTRGLDMDYMDILWGKTGWYDSFWNGNSDTIESANQSIIPNKEKLLALRIKDDQERQAALDLINQKEAEKERHGKRRQALKTFHKLQSTAHALQRLGSHVNQRDVKHLQGKIEYYRNLLEKEEAFAPYLTHLENPLAVMIHPLLPGVVFQVGTVFTATLSLYSTNRTVLQVTHLHPSNMKFTARPLHTKDQSKVVFALTEKTSRDLRPITWREGLEIYQRDNCLLPTLLACRDFGASEEDVLEWLLEHNEHFAVWDGQDVRVVGKEEVGGQQVVTHLWLHNHPEEAMRVQAHLTDPQRVARWVLDRQPEADYGSYEFRNALSQLMFDPHHPLGVLGNQGLKFSTSRTAPYLQVSLPDRK